VDKHTDLISRLQDEADLCRNDGATDIAALLDEAVEALRDRNHDTAVGEKWRTDSRLELAGLRDKIGMAYGYLWCVNNEPCAPDYMPPERMAYEARKLLRDTMTHEQRGAFINRVLPLVRGVGA
jgi:hypothetical protein